MQIHQNYFVLMGLKLCSPPFFTESSSVVFLLFFTFFFDIPFIWNANIHSSRSLDEQCYRSICRSQFSLSSFFFIIPFVDSSQTNKPNEDENKRNVLSTKSKRFRWKKNTHAHQQRQAQIHRCGCEGKKAIDSRDGRIR